jgi:hypothetical protein
MSRIVIVILIYHRHKPIELTNEVSQFPLFSLRNIVALFPVWVQTNRNEPKNHLAESSLCASNMKAGWSHGKADPAIGHA